MNWTVYLTVIGYYLIGTAGIFIINRKKDRQIRANAWIKLLFAFVFTNVVFFSIVFNTLIFTLLAVAVTVAGFLELIKLYRNSRYDHPRFFFTSIVIMAALSVGFIFFSRMDKGLILFSFLIISIFDGFSQISGQLFGRRLLFPKVSPNKTVAGLIGGTLVALLSAIVFSYVVPLNPLNAIIPAFVVVLFAFAGDAAKSVYKRKYNVKDFNKLIPGHGGILDRFDSLITGGAGVALFYILANL